ncbi:unnamed protein product [Caenorhabditis sp. 36 PRJEB53466]|nr:unnamed protein product [Caenorhabditis sp. 36 PRJEB53466]
MSGCETSGSQLPEPLSNQKTVRRALKMDLTQLTVETTEWAVPSGRPNNLKAEIGHEEDVFDEEDEDDEKDDQKKGLGYKLFADALNKMHDDDEEEEEEDEEEDRPAVELVDKDAQERAKLGGVGEMIQQLRSQRPALPPPPFRHRIVLDELGYVERDPAKYPLCRIAEVQQTLTLADHQDGIDLPVQNNPTDVRIVRRMIRQKMVRCKKCKNRFIEKNIYERHLRDKHPALYEEYIREQEEEVELQRLEEIEANRIEELQTGGFIPPENEISQPSEDPDHIPLPGENTGGYVPQFDHYGRIKQMKRPYKKKISPQCPFCDKRFRNEFSLKKHFAKKHEEMIEFKQCLKCFKCLENDAELANHDCELTFVCFECTPIRNLCTDQRLLNHRKKFHRGANSGFRCSFCNMKFLTPRKLRKHKKMSHVFTKTFQCHFCEEIFISEVAVMTHERVHTGIIKFECKVCDFRANRYVTMEEHKKDEHGYICAICHGKFAEYGELKHHVYEEHGGYLAVDEPTAYVETPRTFLLYKGE